MFFFLTLYPREGNGDYPNDPISEWYRQLDDQELNDIENISSVYPVNDIYSQKNPKPKPKKSQTKTQKTPHQKIEKKENNCSKPRERSPSHTSQTSFFFSAPNWTKMTVY